MDIFQLTSGRYLLYLDILGFKEIVRTQAATNVYTIVDRVVSEFKKRGDRVHGFRTLCFSDTIIFYQEPVGWGSWAFSDIYAIAGMAWSALAAHHIPCRGAISFGDFYVEIDSNRLHSLFFGKALIEAHETESHERNRNWIGVTVCPSAWQAVEYMNSGLIDAFAAEGIFVRHGDGLRLIPFIKLPGAFVLYQLGEIDCDLAKWDVPDFPNDVKALRFILEQADRFAQQGDHTSRIAVKYHTTAEVLTGILGDQCVQWAMQAAKDML